jgi:hypothetical protein
LKKRFLITQRKARLFLGEHRNEIKGKQHFAVFYYIEKEISEKYKLAKVFVTVTRKIYLINFSFCIYISWNKKSFSTSRRILLLTGFLAPQLIQSRTKMDRKDSNKSILWI